ncbi:Disease resistance protein (NBS-LRR class) family [Euphorbia peplus]|nr:Disease resistance protein (NBS-LRR class) family [Euphorbia peplus]
MKLHDVVPSDSQDLGLFGIDSRVEDVESLLCIDSVNDVRMLGIWGIGGIGKTTIADKVFHKIMNNFDEHCFISNVSERLSKKQGLKDLREKIIYEILGYRDIKMYSPCADHDFVRRKLKSTKVLIVLDDVQTCMQLKTILKYCGLDSPKSLCSGSRVVVTSRDWRVLENIKMKNDIYEAQPLKDFEALQVFNWHAFGRNDPQREYVMLSKKVVKYAHGVPLALVVLGSEFKLKAKRDWEDAVSTFKTTSPLEIRKILRISFDALSGDAVKIFLDIACFLKGEERHDVENFLEASGFYSGGLNRLIEKSLITETKERITMHDVLQQMGQEIVFEEKQRQRHQSRLWTYKDVRNAFTNTKGTENVEAISLRLDENIYTINISPESFIDMNNLRFLQIHLKVHCPSDLGYLPNTIRYLDWRYYPLSHLPCNFDARKLVELHLHKSQLQQLVWNRRLENLRRIDLRGSGSLVKISNLGMAYNLEVIVLIGCQSLVEIEVSIGNLNKLTELYLHGPQFEELIWNKLLGNLKRIFLSENYSLIRIPDLFRAPQLEVIVIHRCIRLVEVGSINFLKKLSQLDIRGCASLSHISEIPRSITEFEPSNSGLRQIPRTIGRLIHLKKLSFECCKSLESLPNSICNLINLESLNLSNCWSLRKLPYNFGSLRALEDLDASSSGLRELPFSIQNLMNLKILNLSGCKDLEFVPTLSSNIQVVTDSSMNLRRSIGSWFFGH